MKKKTRKTRKMSLFVKLVVPTCFVAVLVSTVLGIVAYRQLNDKLVQAGVDAADMAANIAVNAVDGDLVETIGADSKNTQEYKQTVDSLRIIQEMCGIKYLYILYEENGTVYYGVDADNSKNQAQPGEEFEVTYEELKSVFEGEDYVQDYIDQTEDGALISVYKPIYNDAREVVAILGSDYDAEEIVSSLNQSVSNVLVIEVICIFVSAVLIGFIITRTIKNLRRVDNKIYDLVNSDGDLTKKLDVRSGDELELISDNVNDLLEYIRKIMLSILENSSKLRKSSVRVVRHLADTEVRITDVSATMEEMSAAMEETSASLAGVNESIVQIHNAIMIISDNAMKGRGTSSEVMEKAAEIHSEAIINRKEAIEKAKSMKDGVNRTIVESKAVEEINALTANIIEISDQTDLLALNASIEAARAGEAGKGFAVVADEISKLAKDSSDAANRIGEVSNIVINAVNRLAEESENMVAFMDEVAMAGYDKLLETSESYRNDVENTSSMMQEFAAASEELRRSIDDIKEAIAAVNIAVEESANGISNVTIISTEITEGVVEIGKEAAANKIVSAELNDEVNKFKLS